jgi:hypothetical protein
MCTYTETSNVWIGPVGAAPVVVCDAVKGDPGWGHVISANRMYGSGSVGSVCWEVVVISGMRYGIVM